MESLPRIPIQLLEEYDLGRRRFEEGAAAPGGQGIRGGHWRDRRCNDYQRALFD